MKILLKHIDRIKEKPHHVRKQVAFAAAGTITALIAIFWVATSLATGAFALKDTSFADATGGSAGLAASGSEAENLAGAAAAFGAPPAPARIEIVDAASSTGKKPEPTIIPF